ncbi:hypothetical protein [Micromonospora psammae]|uniref:hypothetical protein n=1 Tax=Micromonospora sp. CPCC 205556 TaxID=3122398 RepID=UPI002FF3B03E
MTRGANIIAIIQKTAATDAIVAMAFVGSEAALHTLLGSTSWLAATTAMTIAMISTAVNLDRLLDARPQVTRLSGTRS